MREVDGVVLEWREIVKSLDLTLQFALERDKLHLNVENYN